MKKSNEQPPMKDHTFELEIIRHCKNLELDSAGLINEIQKSLRKRSAMENSYFFMPFLIFEILMNDFREIRPFDFKTYEKMIRMACPHYTADIGYLHAESCDHLGYILDPKLPKYNYWTAHVLSFCSIIRLTGKSEFTIEI